MKHTVALLIVFLAVALPCPFAKAEITVAVATKSEPVMVDIDETRQVEAGTVINTGNETFKAELEWIQETGDLWLPATVDPTEVTLQPGESRKVKLILGERHKGYIGNYTGYVDILCKPLIPPSSGNPTSPAAGLPLTLVVKYLTPPEFVVSSVDLTKRIVYENDLFQGFATVKNIGEKRGPYTVCARISGELVEERGLTFEAGEIKNLAFNLNVSKAGNYTFSVDDCMDKVPFQVLALKTDFPVSLLTVAALLSLVSSTAGLVVVKRKKNGRRKH